MAEENRFQSEIIRKMDLVIQKLGGYEERFNELDKKVDKNSRDLNLLKKEVRISSGRLSDSMTRVIEMLNRIAEIKKKFHL